MSQNSNVFLINCLFKMMSNFLRLKREGKDLSKYFEDNYIKNVAIYGWNEFGQEIYKELLKLKNIKVLYAIDKNAKNMNEEKLEIFTLRDSLEQVDIVIVTPLQYYNEIEKDLYEKGINNVVSIADIVRYCV